MMKVKVVTILLFFMMSVLASTDYNGKWVFHERLLQKSFDTSWWRNFYPDDQWYVRCIFVDLDGDGMNELLAASPSEEEDRTGYVWKLWKTGGNGNFTSVFFSGDIYFLCHSDSFYKVSYSDKPDVVVGLGMNANVEKDCGNGDRRIVRPTPDCKFVLVPENKFMLREICPDVDTWFRRKDVASIERLYPEWYFGYDFKPPKDVPHSVYTQRMPYKLPKGDLRRGGGIGSPKDFAIFVREYRHEVKNRKRQSGKVTVYVVFLDADNDGDGDCYVSSDIERTTGNKYGWTLYLCRDGRFEKAKADVYPIESRKELCKLSVAANVDKRSFCRVIRYDVEPTFVILDENDLSKSKVRDSITDYYAHRIEKLACEEFHED